VQLSTVLRRLALLSAVALVALGVLIATPYPSDRLTPRTRQSTRVIDRRGETVWERPAMDGGYARFVTLDEVSPFVVRATLAGEDQNFRSHIGIDPAGVARALWLDLQAGRLAYGGSTVTQQLAKLLDREPRTLLGKLVEATDALRLERTLSKDEILEQYLNRAYYGRNAYGIEAAAQRFYGKHASELALDEAALLAVLPRAPSAYDPARHPQRVLGRRAKILARLARLGWVDEAAATNAAAQPLATLAYPRQSIAAPHLVDWLLLSDALPVGIAEVHTTIDLALQQRLEQRVRDHLHDLEGRGVTQAGVVVLEVRTGDLLAMVGSRGYGELAVHGSVNAVTTPRHPGSTLKPFLYALALEDGAHPGTPAFDVPTTYRGYAPRALDRRFRGVVSLREALGSSLNVPATRLAGALGADRFARTLYDAGLHTIDTRPGRYGVSLALGSAETRLVDLAEAYAMLARGGNHLGTRLVLPTAGEPDPRVTNRVLSEESAYLISRMLADARARRRTFGVETPLEFPFEVAVKTGTSQGHQDNVVVGYTPQVVVAVWAGNFGGAPTHEVLAMDGAAPLFRDVMLAATQFVEGQAGGDGQRITRAGGEHARFARPDGIVEREVCPLSGLLRSAHCPHAAQQEMARAHVPTRECGWHGVNGIALPAEVSAWQRGVASLPAADGDARVEILGPANDARFVIDRTTPRSVQAAHLRVAVRAADVPLVRWEVDGVLLAEAPAPYDASLPLVPGTHHVRAVLPDGATDEIVLHVVDGAHR